MCWACCGRVLGIVLACFGYVLFVPLLHLRTRIDIVSYIPCKIMTQSASLFKNAKTTANRNDGKLFTIAFGMMEPLAQ